MAFAIKVDFPLGWYQGRDPLGEPEPYPHLTRIYSSLVAAAFEAPTPLDNSTLLESLAWLEGNPPDAVSLPEWRTSWQQDALAYRKVGLNKTGSGTGGIQAGWPVAGPASRVSALSGPVTYWWNNEPPESQAAVLEFLADEVAYVGERASVARVSASVSNEVPPETMPVSKNFLLPDNRSRTVEYPEVGRLKELSDAHNSRNPKKHPTATQDQVSLTKEREKFAPVPRECVGAARYLVPEPLEQQAPWTRGFLVPIRSYEASTQDATKPGASLPHSEYVTWSVALHRAIVKQIGFGAAPMITGKYAPGVPQPANHMAIQVLPAETTGTLVDLGPRGSFAILFPPEATVDEVSAVRRALAASPSLYRGRAGRLRLGKPLSFDPTRFWMKTKEGPRWWTPRGGVVVEIRGGQRGPTGAPWSLSDALDLAVGFVWRNQLHTDGLRGIRLYQSVVEQIEKLGILVRNAHKEPLLRPKDYVHRIDVPGALTVATGDVWLEPLQVEQQLIAIGQSRHLGGGLLVPSEAPEKSHEAGTGVEQ